VVLCIKRLLLMLLVVGVTACPIAVYASEGVTNAGDALAYALPAVAVAATYFHDDGKGFMELGEAGATTAVVTYGLKYSINETRPNGEAYSFPSAHTSSSFTAAEFLRKRYGWEYGLPAYIAAAFVGYSRVEGNFHYTQDVLAGAAIGILSSYIFTEPYKGWEVSVQVDPGTYGVNVQTKF